MSHSTGLSSRGSVGPGAKVANPSAVPEKDSREVPAPTDTTMAPTAKSGDGVHSVPEAGSDGTGAGWKTRLAQGRYTKE
jgi:hypothetical protein